MSLVACAECGNQVSSQASVCPKCGCPISATTGGAVSGGVATAAPPRVAPPPIPATAPAVQTAAVQSPVLPPRQMRPGGIALGLFLLGLGCWILFSYIPEHDPSKINSLGSWARAVATKEKYLSQEGMQRLSLIGWTLAGLGLLQLLTGSFKRPKVHR